MDWVSGRTLDGLAEGVNEAVTSVASASAAALDEACAEIEALKARLDRLEKCAVSISRSEDSKLEIGPAGAAGNSEKGDG